MANKKYPLWKKAQMDGVANAALNSSEGATGVYVVLLDTGVYTYNAAHQYYSDLSGIVGTDQEILSKTTTGGIFDGTDVTFTSVTGPTVEAMALVRKNAGANTTWPLIIYMDTGVGGLPFTPNGGNETITWHASGIFE